MSLLHKSAPLLCATGVVALAFGAAALIIDANTPAQATVTPCGSECVAYSTPLGAAARNLLSMSSGKRLMASVSGPS